MSLLSDVSLWLEHVKKYRLAPTFGFEGYRHNRRFWLEVLKQSGSALYDIPLDMADASNPINTELLLAAVRQDGMALRFVNNGTLEICQAAVKQNREAIQFVPPELRDQVLQPYRDMRNYKLSGFATKSPLPYELTRPPEGDSSGGLINRLVAGRRSKRRKLRKRTKRF